MLDGAKSHDQLVCSSVMRHSFSLQSGRGHPSKLKMCTGRSECLCRLDAKRAAHASTVSCARPRVNPLQRRSVQAYAGMNDPHVVMTLPTGLAKTVKAGMPSFEIGRAHV